MRIFLVRHAEAQPLDTVENDEDRALTPEGAEKTRKACRGLRRMDLFPNRILSSPLKRALQTADIIKTELGFVGDTEPVEELAPGADPEDIIAFLETLHIEQILLVGHQPLLGQIVNHLITMGRDGQIGIKKGGLARVDVENWKNEPPGKLRWLLSAKHLRWMKKKKKKGDKAPL